MNDEVMIELLNIQNQGRRQLALYTVVPFRVNGTVCHSIWKMLFALPSIAGCQHEISQRGGEMPADELVCLIVGTFFCKGVMSLELEGRASAIEIS